MTFYLAKVKSGHSVVYRFSNSENDSFGGTFNTLLRLVKKNWEQNEKGEWSKIRKYVKQEEDSWRMGNFNRI